MKSLNTFTVLAASAVAVSMGACKGQAKAETSESQDSQTPKTLVLYYSQSGTTKTLAEAAQALLGADIEAIEAETPYDADYQATIARCMQEMQTGETPKIKPLQSKVEDYDVIFLAYPIWFGTYARPIMGLIAEQDFADKKIVPLVTFGSGGLEASAKDLAAALPKAQIAEGYGVRQARTAAINDELAYFLKSQGYIEGEFEALPEFSEAVAVTPDDVAIFDAACSNYQFPLGTPVKVSSRQNGSSQELKYEVESRDPSGATQISTIYVLVPDGEGSAPEFTRVVR